MKWRSNQNCRNERMSSVSTERRPIFINDDEGTDCSMLGEQDEVKKCNTRHENWKSATCSADRTIEGWTKYISSIASSCIIQLSTRVRYTAWVNYRPHTRRVIRKSVATIDELTSQAQNLQYFEESLSISLKMTSKI